MTTNAKDKGEFTRREMLALVGGAAFVGISASALGSPVSQADGDFDKDATLAKIKVFLDRLDDEDVHFVLFIARDMKARQDEGLPPLDDYMIYRQYFKS